MLTVIFCASFGALCLATFAPGSRRVNGCHLILPELPLGLPAFREVTRLPFGSGEVNSSVYSGTQNRSDHPDRLEERSKLRRQISEPTNSLSVPIVRSIPWIQSQRWFARYFRQNLTAFDHAKSESDGPSHSMHNSGPTFRTFPTAFPTFQAFISSAICVASANQRAVSRALQVPASGHSQTVAK
jgi:hypothetical protein